MILGLSLKCHLNAQWAFVHHTLKGVVPVQYAIISLRGDHIHHLEPNSELNICWGSHRSGSPATQAQVGEFSAKLSPHHVVFTLSVHLYLFYEAVSCLGTETHLADPAWHVLVAQWVHGWVNDICMLLELASKFSGKNSQRTFAA